MRLTSAKCVKNLTFSTQMTHHVLKGELRKKWWSVERSGRQGKRRSGGLKLRAGCSPVNSAVTPTNLRI